MGSRSSFCNELNDVQVIDLYIWLIPTSVTITFLKDGKLDLQALTNHHIINKLEIQFKNL